jgi:peptidylprolyl isomerase
MKLTVFALFMGASALAAAAQTPAKPAAPAASARRGSPPCGCFRIFSHQAASWRSAVVKGIVKTAFSLHYEDYKIGTGALAEPNKLYKVHYTGWLAADGHKFDSSYDHPGAPVLDKDGKPVMGEDGKPKKGEPQPMAFPQGMGRLIPGFDQGFEGMKIGGKRRLFIPWQLAYGARGRPGPDAAHPGIPAKADLIFDVELVDVTDMPTPPSRPGMGGMPGGRPMPPGAPPAPGAQTKPGTPATPSTPTPGSAPSAAPPTTPAAPAQPAPGTTAPSAAPATPPAPKPSTPASPSTPPPSH